MSSTGLTSPHTTIDTVTTTFSGFILPKVQRRTPDELTQELDLTAGDSTSKRSAFWAMLAFSAVIAAAGLLSDSTATVIGAMIIAPLSTPIMGMALGIAKLETGGVRKGGRFVFFGSLVVIFVGALFALGVPGGYDLLGNEQIASRTSPGLLSLVAAVATGFAGAVALARRDVAAVLPGVAIAISLVPPLAVVGICLGQRSFALAAGALVLYLSNLLAMVLAGTIVFSVLVIQRMDNKEEGSRRKAVATILLLMVVITVPLATNTVINYLVTIWDQRITKATSEWLEAVPGATVEDVDFASNKILIRVQSPEDLPPTSDLTKSLEGKVPNGIPVVVTTTVGQDIEAGVTGQ